MTYLVSLCAFFVRLLAAPAHLITAELALRDDQKRNAACQHADLFLFDLFEEISNRSGDRDLVRTAFAPRGAPAKFALQLGQGRVNDCSFHFPTAMASFMCAPYSLICSGV